MIASIEHINDYKLAHRYLCGDKAAGQELYAAIFLILKGFIYAQPNARSLSDADKSVS